MYVGVTIWWVVRLMYVGVTIWWVVRLVYIRTYGVGGPIIGSYKPTTKTYSTLANAITNVH